jgi:hypothetical protein
MDPGTMALLGSLVMGGLSGFGGKKEKHGSTYSKTQRRGLEEIMKDVMGMKGVQNITQQPGYQTGNEYLQSLFNNPDFFNRFEAPLQRQFQEQTIPDLANRFASMGSGGSLGSTGFRNQLAREGSNLETNIGALRGNMMQQAVPQLLGYSQQPFSNYLSLLQTALTPTNNTYQPASSGFFGPIASSFAGAAGQGFGQQFGQNMASQYNPINPNRFPGQSPSTI